jgi:uncharacterized membrane protein
MALSGTSRRRLAALAVLVLASAFSVSLVALRFVLSGAPHYANLVWNLVLAWVPFVLALAAYDRHRRGSRGPALWLSLGLWLAFLPNAPYLVTDFMLLRDIRDMPVWFDVGVLTSFAWTGLLLGFASVYLVQEVARRALGPAGGWLCVVGSFGACGIGIYLGRVLRWNSWDLLVRPSGVLGDVAASLQSPRLVGMSLLMAAFLTVAYAMLYAFVRAAADERPR